MRIRTSGSRAAAHPRTCRPRALLSVTFAALGLAPFAAAQQPSRKPPLPPGRDPGGVAIALLGTGLDYTRPEVVRRLARDGEGELIGWDLKDNDNRPFRASGQTPAAAEWGDGTALALMIGAPGRRIVPVRIDPGDPQSLVKAVAFVAQTPARLVAVPIGSGEQKHWEPFRQAALRFKDLLFIAAGDGSDSDPAQAWPAAFALGNVLAVAAAAAPTADTPPGPSTGAPAAEALVSLSRLAPPGDGGEPARSSLAVIVAADAIAGCWPGLVEAYRGEALKKAVLAQAAKPAAGSALPVIEPCPAGARKP